MFQFTSPLILLKIFSTLDLLACFWRYLQYQQVSGDTYYDTSKFLEIHTSKFLEMLTRKFLEVLTSKFLEILTSKFLEIHISKFLEILTSKILDTLTSKFLERGGGICCRGSGLSEG